MATPRKASSVTGSMSEHATNGERGGSNPPASRNLAARYPAMVT